MKVKVIYKPIGKTWQDEQKDIEKLVTQNCNKNKTQVYKYI